MTLNTDEDHKKEIKELDRRRWFDLYKEVDDHDPVCPYCFKKYGDWWESFRDEDGYTTDLECDYCGKEFKAVLHINYSFITTRKE